MWIKERIYSEYKKHNERLDWSRIAEAKIITQLKEEVNEWEDDCVKSNDFVRLSFEELVTKLEKRLFGKCG